jgi:inner membrane protein
MLHSLLFGTLLSLLLASLNVWAGFGFFAGYLSHLFLDFLTKSGVELLWPISDKKFGLFIRTGGLIEEVFFVLLLILDFFLLFRMFLSPNFF